MKKIIAFVVTILVCSACFAEIISTQYPYYTRNPMYFRNKTYASQYSLIPNKNLKALEKYALKKSYSGESDLQRLERLEELAFGSIQSGDIATRYNNVEHAILSSPQNNYNSYNKSLLNRIGNYFAGQTTGFTPNIYSYDNYGTNYNNSRFEQFGNSLFNNGYRIFNNNYGTGSGIRILD